MLPPGYPPVGGKRSVGPNGPFDGPRCGVCVDSRNPLNESKLI